MNPASFSAFCDDGTGPIPMMFGSTPATAHDTMRPFFFQAEAGIRVYKVTGVQTCALPILRWARRRMRHRLPADRAGAGARPLIAMGGPRSVARRGGPRAAQDRDAPRAQRARGGRRRARDAVRRPLL